MWSASKWLWVLVLGLNRHSRSWGEYKTCSDLLHLWGKCEEKVEFHFKSGARSWEESFVKWYRKGQARELQHLLGSGERHNRSRYQQAAAPKPQQRQESTRHSPCLLPAVAAALAGLWEGALLPPTLVAWLLHLHHFRGFTGLSYPEAYFAKCWR